VNNFTIVAKHPGFGEVSFTLAATDAKAAFSTWKNIVGSGRQWQIVTNEKSGYALVTPAPQAPAPEVGELDEL